MKLLGSELNISKHIIELIRQSDGQCVFELLLANTCLRKV